jgi:hypothetical protein
VPLSQIGGEELELVLEELETHSPPLHAQLVDVIVSLMHWMASVLSAAQ